MAETKPTRDVLAELKRLTKKLVKTREQFQAVIEAAPREDIRCRELVELAAALDTFHRNVQQRTTTMFPAAAVPSADKKTARMPAAKPTT